MLNFTHHLHYTCIPPHDDCLQRHKVLECDRVGESQYQRQVQYNPESRMLPLCLLVKQYIRIMSQEISQP